MLTPPGYRIEGNGTIEPPGHAAPPAPNDAHPLRGPLWLTLSLDRNCRQFQDPCAALIIMPGPCDGNACNDEGYDDEGYDDRVAVAIAIMVTAVTLAM
ncbi:hypothetical protein CHU98_g2793 [Xylaria longipes]|nr:hypothetical protein CHU98_g2793 [Xylaria longipes]